MPDPRSPSAVATRLLLERPPRLGTVRLGVVDGPSGSGKSTLASAWAQAVRDAGRGSVAVISSDLIATWDDPFGWWARLDGGVLRPLADGKPGRIRLTDWTGGDPRPGDWVDIPMVDVLILEGVSCGRRELQGRASVVVWVSLTGHRAPAGPRRRPRRGAVAGLAGHLAARGGRVLRGGPNRRAGRSAARRHSRERLCLSKAPNAGPRTCRTVARLSRRVLSPHLPLAASAGWPWPHPGHACSRGGHLGLAMA